MARKNIPIAKPHGSDGQGNIKVTGGPLVLDLGDFDDMFGPMESDAPQQGPIGEFWSGLKESLSDRLRTKDVVRNFLRSAAPDGISNLMGFADEAMSATRDIKESLERTNAGDLQYIAKRAQALLPKLQDYTSESMFNDISQGLENKIDEYDYTIQSQRDQTAIRRAGQEQRQENEIQSALDNIALSNKLSHNRSEQAASYRHNQKRAESSIRDVLQTKRFDFIARSMGVVADGIQQVNGYNQQVDYGFQRKGLELQFRSYMGIKELVKLQEANLELNARAYDSIVRNTGMTDFQKNGDKSLTQFGTGPRKQGLLGRAVAGATNRTLSNFLGNYGGEVQSRVTSNISQKLSMAVMAAKMGENGPNLWDQKYKMAGSMAGDMGGDFLLNTIIPMLGREARPGLTNLSDKHLGGRHNQAGYMLDNMPAFMQEFVNNNQNQHGMKGKIRNMIAPFVPQFGLQDRLQSGTFQTIDQPAQFNQMTQRTITDAIPGYLARLLQEVRMIRTGSDSVAREVFDITSGTFTTETTAHDNIQNKIIPKNSIRSASSTINDALNTMDEDGQLSPEARKALSERMLRDASTNRRFDPEAYIKSGGYAKDLPPEQSAELEKFFKSKFEFDDKGVMVGNAKNHKLRQEFSQAFLDIRSISRDPIKEIQRMINTGHTEPLRAIGIIITEDGVDKINYPRIWEVLRSGVTDGNPFAPGGSGDDPTKDDTSGVKGSKDFMGPAAPKAGEAFLKNNMARFRRRYAPEEQAARDQMAKQMKAMRGRYGSAAETVQQAMSGMTETGQPGLTLGGAGNAINNLMAGAKSSADKFVGTLPGNREEKADYLAPGMAKLTDLYSQFDPTKPVIKGVDFSQGGLIDVNTKKVISTPTDITGEVINRLGQTVVTATEVASGLLNPTGELVIKVAENTAGIVGKALTLNRKKGGEGSTESGEPTDPNSEEALNSQDWALGPGEDAILTGRGLMNGEYYDQAGKVISSIKSIAGDVFDKSGNLLISAKEFANGLWSKRTGQRYKPTKGFGKLLGIGKAMGKFSGRTAHSLAWGATKFLGKAAIGVATKTFNILVDNQNAYMPGEKTPIFTRRGVQNGEYYTEDGKIIDDFVDVYSPIHDAKGELIIPAESYQQLTNYDGTPHTLAKNRKIWGKYVMRPLRAMRNAYGRATKKYYKWLGRTTVKVGKGIGNKLLGGFAKAGGNVLNRMFDKVGDDPQAQATMEATAAGTSMAQQPMVETLGAILQELKDQKPKEKRKGSWQDQADKKSLLGDGPKKDDGEEDEKKDGFFKRGLKGLAGLLGLGKKEDDEGGFGLEDAADMAEIGDAAGNARERRRARKAGKPKGRLARWGSKIAGSKVGQFVAKSSVGMIATRGLAMAGTAVASVLSAPVLLGIAAVAGVAAGGYWLYSRHRDTSGDFRALRLAQYGISSTGEQLKILKLEELLEKYTDKNAEVPSLSINGAGGKEILEILGIEIEDEPAVMNMARWLEKRFKPVYLAYVGGLKRVGQEGVKINEIDDKVPPELKGDLLEAVRFPYSGETPYAFRMNPFSPEEELPDNIAEISGMFDKLKGDFASAKKEKDEKDKTAKIEGSKADPAKATTVAATAGAAAAGTGALSASQQLAAEGKAAEKASSNVLTTPGSIAATAATAGSMSGTIANLNQRVGNTLTALQAIRMRAYGMQTLALAQVKAVMALEAIYAKDLTVSEFSVDYNGSIEDLLKEAGQLLGKDVATGSNDRPKLYNWLIYRFAPVFRSFYGTAKNAQPAAQLSGLESKLTGSDKVTVANAILGSIDGIGNSIWILPSIFEITGDPKELKLFADEDLKVLQKEAEKEVVNSPSQKGSDQMAGKNAADKGGSFADRAMDTIKDTWESTKDTVSSAWSKTTDTVGDTVASAKIAMGLGSDYGEGGAKGGTVQSTGSGGKVMAGNGGKWESIPFPASSGSIKDAFPTLKAVSAMTGVPLDWLLVIAGIESNFKYDVKAATSSATGWYQMINATWDFMMKRCADKYGLPADPGREGRKDPRINALLGAELIKYNWDQLKAGLKRDNLTDVDVYMAHFLGVGGALKFFRADPNALAYKVFQKEYSANMPLFFVNSKPSQPRTISEFYQMFAKKIAKFWETTGKGYRSAEGSTGPVTPEAQSPGTTQSAQSVSEDTLAANLKADAGNKDGVAADTPAATEPKDNIQVESVSSIASKTGPMPGAPASGGGSTSPNSGTNSTGTESGGAAVDTQRQAQQDVAQSQNARREAEVRKDQKTASEVSDVQDKQLNTLYEIRDLMKTAFEQVMAKMSGGESSSNGSSASQSGNSMTPSGIQSRSAAQRPSAVTLK